MRERERERRKRESVCVRRYRGGGNGEKDGERYENGEEERQKGGERR